MSRIDLALDADELALRDVARSFMGKETAPGDVRALRQPGAPGFRPDVWEAMAALEWIGLGEPEDRGGSGAGIFHLGIIAEELGRGLVASPFLTTATSLAALAPAGTPSARKAYDHIVGGGAVVAFAHQEDADFRAALAGVRAESVGGGFRLTGRKAFVPYAGQADHLVVTAVLAGTPALFLLEPGTPGIDLTDLQLVDAQRCGHLRLDATLGGEALLAEGAVAEDALTRALLRGTALAGAEIVGSLHATAELAFGYLREREQFGVPIGTFQALQHRAARMHVAVELAVSIVRAALRALDAGDPDAAEAVSAAKACANDAFALVAREALQMHGGLGMTDEADVGLYVKRALVAAAQFGSSSYHRGRIADLRLGDR